MKENQAAPGRDIKRRLSVYSRHWLCTRARKLSLPLICDTKSPFFTALLHMFVQSSFEVPHIHPLLTFKMDLDSSLSLHLLLHQAMRVNWILKTLENSPRHVIKNIEAFGIYTYIQYRNLNEWHKPLGNIRTGWLSGSEAFICCKTTTNTSSPFFLVFFSKHSFIIIFPPSSDSAFRRRLLKNLSWEPTKRSAPNWCK